MRIATDIGKSAIIRVSVIITIMVFVVLILAFVMLEGYYRRQHEHYNFDEDIFGRVSNRTFKVCQLSLTFAMQRETV